MDDLTLEAFRDELSKLLGRTMNLDKEEVLEELQMQVDALKDEIADGA